MTLSTISLALVVGLVGRVEDRVDREFAPPLPRGALLEAAGASMSISPSRSRAPPLGRRLAMPRGLLFAVELRVDRGFDGAPP
jgi:hypothetical protein